LYRYLHSAGASAADAEDIAQESLIRLYRQLHQGAQIREVRPWVFHVARNLLIDEKRKWNRRVSLQTDWQTQSRVEGRADPALNPEERAAQRQRLDRLYASVEELTELQRECLSLRAEGLRYREIASILDLSLSTVSDAVHRAVLNLRRRLE
jgi:RNA polymerase sigma-70 factor (ECF subfamily)